MSNVVETVGIKELAKMTVDLRKSAVAVDAVICSYMTDQMITQGNRKWANLAKSTLKKPRRSEKPFDTIKRRMRDSFTQRKHPLHDFRSGKDFIISGSEMDDIPYWQMVDDNHIPNRPIFVTRDMADEITEIIADEIIRSGS